MVRDGVPWFVAADVCEALDIGNVTNALKRLDDDEQALYSIKGIHYGEDLVNVVNESGLYSLILTSRKFEAKRFRKGVSIVYTLKGVSSIHTLWGAHRRFVWMLFSMQAPGLLRMK